MQEFSWYNLTMQVSLYVWLAAGILPFIILLISWGILREAKRIKKPTLEDRFKFVRKLEQRIRELERQMEAA
jgi:hypothetical protein